MQRDFAAIDTLPIVDGLNSVFLTYFSIFFNAESEILSLSCSISSFKNDGLPKKIIRMREDFKNRKSKKIYIQIIKEKKKKT